MTILRIEHPVPDFDAWKKAFDSDPAGREAGGVRSYRVFRALDDRNYALVDLEFEDPAKARAFLKSLEGLWRKVEGSLIAGPQAKLLEDVEQVRY